MDQTQAIQHKFGAAAERYVMSAVHRGGPDLDAMLAEGVITGRERVLDVGCGPGATALAFAARVASVVALDLTPAMLDQARRQAAERGLANVRFECGNAERLPFPDASFDVIISNGVIDLIPDKDAVFSELFRVLAPGGRMQIADVTIQNPVSAEGKRNIDLWTG